MKHWQLRSVYRNPETSEVIGYGRPFTMPPGAAQMWARKYASEVEVVSTAFEVPDAYVGASTPSSKFPNIVEATAAGETLLANAGLRVNGGKLEKADPMNPKVDWKAGEMHAPVSVSDAKGRR